MNFIKKWYTYQKERFPVIVFSLYVFCIVFAVFCFSNRMFEIVNIDYILNHPQSQLMGAPMLYNIEWSKIILMFIVAFLQFLMVRIVDEFKDYEEDCKYRPYRPVPRGVIKLNELKVLFVICVLLQLIITLVYNKSGLIFLILLWIFFAIMSKGFFIKKFLEKHLLIEVTLDELLMPMLVTYLSSFIYIGSGLWKLLIMSYIISWIVELARKIRCKEDEEKGVRTYTAVFGIQGAIFILFILETLLMGNQLLILGTNCLLFVIGIYVLVNIFNILFVTKQTKKFAKMVELSANIYIMLAYLGLGLLLI